MKHIITAIALLALTAPALAEPQVDPEYRMWAAESMTKHLVKRLGRMTAACNNSQLQMYLPKASEACTAAVMSAYPMLNTIREVAAGGDDIKWAIMMDVIRRLEKDTEAPLQALERK